MHKFLCSFDHLPSTPVKQIGDDSQCSRLTQTLGTPAKPVHRTLTPSKSGPVTPSTPKTGTFVHETTPSKSGPATPNTPKTGTFKANWETEFLVTISQDRAKLVCLICGQKLSQIKKDNARKHMLRNHKDAVEKMTIDTKKKLKEKYITDMKKGQEQVQQFLGPQNLIQTAPYKLAYTIAKHKMPFSSCDAFLEFAKAADPESVVFQKMAASRQTVTRKAVEVHQKIIQTDVVSGLKRALFWSYIIDESMDKKLKEQLGTELKL